MIKALWFWITNIFTKQFIHTSEKIGFSKTESVKEDLSQLTITIGGTKSMVNAIEKEARLKLYQLMAEQATKDNATVVPSTNIANSPLIFRHQNKQVGQTL